jgi:WD40 repeat protein/tetratricopeptide (TPR) repeat protein
LAASRFRSLAEREEELRKESQQQTQIATEALVQAETERERADRNKGLAEERESLARRNLYAAHMNLAQKALENADIPRAKAFLERHVPMPGEKDWRSFEWYYLAGLCNSDELTIDTRHSWSRPEFSPDSTLFAVAIGGQQIELWNVERRQRVQVIKDDSVNGPVAFSPDGRMLASTGNGQLKLWDVGTGRLIRSMPGHAHHVLSIVFTPDGSRVISTDGGNLDKKNIVGIIRVWNSATGDLIHELKGHTAYVHNIAVSPDGSRLVSTGRAEVLFWDLLSGERIEGLRVAGGNWGSSVSWSPDGRSVATYRKGIVYVWDSATGQQTSSFSAPEGTLRYSPDGRSLVMGHSDGTVGIWEIESGDQIAEYKGHDQGVAYVTVSPDGSSIASVGRDLQAKIWAVDKSNRVDGIAGAGTRRVDQSGRNGCAISPDGSCLAGLNGTSVVLINPSTHRERSRLEVGSPINALAFSPDGSQIAVAHKGGIQIWDWSAADMLCEYRSDAQVSTVAFSPEGQTLAADLGSTQVAVFACDSLELQSVLPWQYVQPLRKVTFSPSGDLLATVSTGSGQTLGRIHLWDTEGWRIRFAIAVEQKFLTDVAFSLDGAMLAVSEGSIFQPNDGASTRLIDTGTGTQVANLRSGGAYHTAVAFPTAGNAVATATDMGEVTLWDLETHEERLTIRFDGGDASGKRHEPVVESMYFSPDGSGLIASNWRAQVWSWPTAEQDRVEQLERAGLLRRANRYATEGRWSEAVDIHSHILQQGIRFQEILWSRANALAELGRWEEALQDFEELLASNPQQVRRWYEMALAQLASGDEDAYRSTCERMIDQFRETNDPIAAEFVSWTSCLSAQRDCVDELTLAAELFYNGQPSMAAYRTLGAVLLRAGLPEESIAVLEKAENAVEQEHARTSPYYSLYLQAIAHAQLGDIAKAHKYLDRTQTPNDVDSDSGKAGTPWFRRATLTVLRHECERLLKGSADNHHAALPPDRERRLASGLRYCSQAIEVKPDIPVLYEVRASVHRHLGQTRQAEADFARAEHLKKTSRLRRIDRLVESERLDRRFLRLERARHLFEEAQDYDTALEDCHIVLEGPNVLSPEALELLFEIHKARGTLDVCDKHWPEELGSPPPAEFFLARSRFYGQQGEQAKAIADLEQARKLAQSTFSLRETSQHFRKQGLREMSVKILTAALATDPNSSELYNDRAYDYIVLGEYEQALADCNEAIRLDPQSPRALAERAWAYIEIGDYVRAIADCSKAISIDPNDFQAHFRRSRAYCLNREIEKAMLDAERAVEIDPTQAESLANFLVHHGETLREQGQNEKAIELFTNAIGLDPGNAWAFGRRAVAYCFSRDFEKAIADCDTAIEINPQDALAYADRAWARIESGSFDQAIADCNEAIRLSPECYWAFQRRSWANRMLGNYEQAKRDSMKAIEIDPTIPSGKGELKKTAVAFVESEQWDQAIDCFGNLIDAEPEDVYHHSKRADCELILNGVELYRRRCREVFELFATPESSVKDKRMVVTMCNAASGAFDETAAIVQLAREVVEANPPPAQWNKKALANALLRDGQSEEALPLLAELESDETDGFRGQTLYLLAMAHHEAGDPDKSANWLKQADAWTSDYLEAGEFKFPLRPFILRHLKQEAHELLEVPILENEKVSSP